MEFVVRATREKDPASYKSLYIKDSLLREVERIAKKNSTSFNNVVVSMIEACISDSGEGHTKKNKSRK